MGDLFKHGWKGFSTGPTQQALESRSEQSQGAGSVWISQQAFVLAPADVPLPMAAFAAPMGLDLLRHNLRGFIFLVPAGDEVSGEFLFRSLDGFFGLLLGCGVVVRFQELLGLGKDGALRVGRDGAEFTHNGASVVAVG